jgi:hypothetical protein
MKKQSLFFKPFSELYRFSPLHFGFGASRRNGRISLRYPSPSSSPTAADTAGERKYDGASHHKRTKPDFFS